MMSELEHGATGVLNKHQSLPIVGDSAPFQIIIITNNTTIITTILLPPPVILTNEEDKPSHMMSLTNDRLLMFLRIHVTNTTTFAKYSLNIFSSDQISTQLCSPNWPCIVMACAWPLSANLVLVVVLDFNSAID
jgi:hypothetical protein